MNKYLQQFVEGKFQKPGKSLDLGAGDFEDVNFLKNNGWQSDGVDLTGGIDLKQKFIAKNHPYDLVYSNYVIHKILNQKIFIETIFNNLKKDGFVFLHTFEATDKNSHSTLTEKSLYDLLSKQKFKKIKIQIIPYYDAADGHDHWHKIFEATAQK
jgi:methyltransferase family protein